MIVSHYHRYIFISVPKCATNSLYLMLNRNFKGVRLPGAFHQRVVPDDCTDYFRFTIVRNPYERAVSIWYQATQQNHDRYGVRKILGTGADRFEEFTEWLCQRKYRRPLFLPINEWLGNLQFDIIMRLEQLRRDMNQLPFVKRDIEELPHLNPAVATRDHWSRYYTPRAFDCVRIWAGCDFDRYRYSIDPFDDLDLPLQTVPEDGRSFD